MLPRLVPHLHWLWRQLQDLILPPRCVGCKQVGANLCERCVQAIVPFSPPRCPVCDLPTSHPHALCVTCQTTPTTPLLDGLRVVGPYQEPIRSAIRALKYKGVRSLATPLGWLMAERWQQAGAPIDGVLPVPLHPERHRARGYNQSELLAHQVAHVSGYALRTDVVRRIRATAPQVELDRAARHQNVRGAFEADGTAGGQRWLLVDDVCTTKATLEACADALRIAGARAVWALTLARPYHLAGEGAIAGSDL